MRFSINEKSEIQAPSAAAVCIYTDTVQAEGQTRQDCEPEESGAAESLCPLALSISYTHSLSLSPVSAS
jgi:hypothetical protein